MMRSSLLFLAVFAIVAAPPHALAADDSRTVDERPLFYPSAPNPPRIQYLTKFSSAYDLSGGNKKFRNFVFGGEENEEQVVQKPYGLAIHNGAIYVVDTRGSGYVVFDVANNKWRSVTGRGSGTMKKPINITIDDDGTRYVTDTEREAVLVYDANDRFVRQYGEPGQFRPIDVAIGGDRLYVTDAMNQKIHVLDKASGETLFAFGTSGNRPGQMVHPTNVSLGPDGSIYLSDTTNFRVQQFSPDGDYVRQLGSVGTGIGQFARPKGISVDRDGRIYVVDAAFQNVQLFDGNGQTLMYFGGPGNGRGSMSLPTVVKIDYDNVRYFQKYAAPGFRIEYLILVANQFGQNKVAVYGFGSLAE